MTWAPDYATLGQLKGWLKIGDTEDDTELATVLTAASRAVDVACARQFGQVASAQVRTYEAVYNRHVGAGAWVAEIDDVQDLTGLGVSVAGTSVTDYSFEPVNALVEGMPYTRLVLGSAAEAVPTTTAPSIDVTAKWGWVAVPDTVLQAVKLQSSRLFKRRDAPFGIAGSPDAGSELRLLAKVDPDVELILKRYVRKWWAR